MAWCTESEYEVTKVVTLVKLVENSIKCTHYSYILSLSVSIFFYVTFTIKEIIQNLTAFVSMSNLRFTMSPDNVVKV